MYVVQVLQIARLQSMDVVLKVESSSTCRTLWHENPALFSAGGGNPTMMVSITLVHQMMDEEMDEHLQHGNLS